MSLVKILVTLPQLIMGGADVRSLNTLQALKMLGYDVSPFIFSFNAKPYFINYLIPYSSLFKHLLNSYLNNYNGKVIVIVTYPQHLYHFLELKKVSSMNISVLWLPGGNDFCCPLHTEVCPKSALNSSYGCAYNVSFFFTKCTLHMLHLRKFSVYHSLIWPCLRYKVIRCLDGLLASRGIYVKGCEHLGYEKCYYVGFGINTEMFKHRDKEHTMEMLPNLSKHILWGNFYDLLESIRRGEGIVIGYIGAAEPWWKNVETLLLAFKRLHYQALSSIKHRIWLLIVGRSTNKLFTFLNALNEYVKKNIVIMSRLNHEIIPYIYNIVDIFVNPSYLDSLEFNTLEALASGNIVLASNRGSIDDLKYFNINVLKFEPSSNSLTKLLMDVLHSLESLKKTFLIESNRIREIFGLEAYAYRLKKVLDRYIKRT